MIDSIRLIHVASLALTATVHFFFLQMFPLLDNLLRFPYPFLLCPDLCLDLHITFFISSNNDIIYTVSIWYFF